MATGQTKKNEEVQADPSEVKRKLAWRMGFAGLMIVALLGSLALFDRLSSPSVDETSAPQFSEPVPVAKKVITQPVTPIEPAPEAAKAESKEPAKVESKEPAKAESKEPAKAAPESEVTAAPVDRSAPRVGRPSRPEVAAPAAPPRATPPPARAAAAAPKAAGAAAPRSEATVAAEPTPTPAPPRLFSGYALQAGVFSDPRRAEALQARLVLEGLPATVEARVQVGPFKNHAEAEAALEKMKAMGVDAVLLPPKGVKH